MLWFNRGWPTILVSSRKHWTNDSKFRRRQLETMAEGVRWLTTLLSARKVALGWGLCAAAMLLWYRHKRRPLNPRQQAKGWLSRLLAYSEGPQGHGMLYRTYLEEARSDTTDPVRREDLAQIEKDLPRTLCTSFRHPCMQRLLRPIEPTQLTSCLRHVLQAFVIRQSKLGYTQGLNEVGAMLLGLLSDDEAAFWVLSTLVEQILPVGFYDRELTGVGALSQLCIEHSLRLFPALLHKVGQKECHCAWGRFYPRWLLKLFVDELPLPTVTMVWGHLISTGSPETLLIAALACTSLAEAAVLKGLPIDEAYQKASQCDVETLQHAMQHIAYQMQRPQAGVERKDTLQGWSWWLAWQVGWTSQLAVSSAVKAVPAIAAQADVHN